MSQSYIHENLVRIQQLVHKIFLQTRKCDTDANADANGIQI